MCFFILLNDGVGIVSKRHLAKLLMLAIITRLHITTHILQFHEVPKHVSSTHSLNG